MISKKKLLQFFESHKKRKYKVAELQKHLSQKKSQRRALRAMLSELQDEGRIHKFKGGRYGLIRSEDILTGKISIARKGYGFLRPDVPDGEKKPPPDVFIKQRNLKGAMDGDRAAVVILMREGDRSEGRVLRIIKRARTELIGQFHYERRGGVVIPRDRKIDRIVYVPRTSKIKNLGNGAWALVKIEDYGDGRQPMTGEIIDVIGYDEEKGIDILLIIRDYGVKPEFPDDIIEEAEKLSLDISDEEIAKRKDLRDQITFTIDPETAKDFDDALSIRKLDNGMFRLGVHIADVAHYVRPGSLVDEEAFKRATSIYPVDRVIPMLPEHLSNKLCSLRPEEDRLTMSVFMDIDDQGKVHHSEFYNSVIHSRFRLNYNEVQSIFDHSAPWLSAQYSDITEPLMQLKNLSEILIEMRDRKGALDLDVGETEVIFDSQGRVIDLTRHSRFASHRLVEQCMILANEAVASKMSRVHAPSLYRIHEPPSQDKLHSLVPFLEGFGIRLPRKRNITSQRLQKALDQTEKLGDAGPIVRKVILRAMMRAKYSPENLGHYGLGSSCYTHFTSPIRRYPDLVVHRILKEVIAGNHKDPSRVHEWEERLPAQAEHCSSQERVAQEIEYEAVYLLGLEFMRQFLGEEFKGIISGVTGFGMFVELEPYPIEGMIPIAKIGKEYFEYDEKTLSLVGKRSGRRFRIADRIVVSLDHINIAKREMDLGLVRKLKK